jgi:hypothetical protein
VVSFTPRSLYPQGKSPWYPLDRRLGGPQSRSGRGGEEKNSQHPPGIEPYKPDRPAHNSTLCLLSYRGFPYTSLHGLPRVLTPEGHQSKEHLVRSKKVVPML